jgi:glycosyltransferase involved in cell wall biosynthesis
VDPVDVNAVARTLAGMSAHLLFLVTADWYFCSHRLALAHAALEAGYRVSVMTQEEQHGEQIRALGVELIPVHFPRGERAPARELVLLNTLRENYRRLQPDIVHHVAIKPVLYGAFAAHCAGTALTVNAIAGLGYLFTSSHLRARLMRQLVSPMLKAALRRQSAWTIVQNKDDETILRDLGILDHERVKLIAGSGVDLDKFCPVADSAAVPLVLVAARMLADKGIHEFVQAARLLHSRAVRAHFVLVGDVDPDNPSSLSVQTLNAWNAEGVVQWWGHRDDMPEVFAAASIVCLPSYREGFPKVLIEACAAGRACVTTDVPGCRDVVDDGINGLLVPVRDALALADALQRLIVDVPLRQAMGARARERAERDFDVRQVADATLQLYTHALDTLKSRT